MPGFAPVSHLSPQSLLLHQAINAMLATGFAEIVKVADDLAIALDTAAFQPGLLDQPQQALIVFLP
jgi:hypothetical protein